MLNSLLQNSWAMLLGSSVLLLVATELGFRMGAWHTPEKRKTRQGQSNALQAALLGMLGLLLGFTFAMAVGRYDARKKLALDEANAIGTAWLRAALLSDSARDTVRTTLSDYIAIRLAGAAAPAGSDAFHEAQAKSEQGQATLWRTIVAEVRARDTPSNALVTSALNDLIDLDTKRQGAFRNHVPSTVWLLLLLVAVTVCWTTGYTTSLGESGRHPLSMFVLPLLLASVLGIIADLDNPQGGLITVSQGAMIELQQTLRKYQ